VSLLHPSISRVLRELAANQSVLPRAWDEGIENTDDHCGFGGEKEELRVEELRAVGRGRGRIVAELMQQARFGGLLGIRGDAVDVGPNEEFVASNEVRDDGPEKSDCCGQVVMRQSGVRR